MMENFGLSASDVHVIGFSLGGQLVAFIGQQTNGALARITGLDPAGSITFFNADTISRKKLIICSLFSSEKKKLNSICCAKNMPSKKYNIKTGKLISRNFVQQNCVLKNTF